MRVLLVTHTGYGHLHPLVPLARALISEGHEVAFSTPEWFCPEVEKLGFHALAAGYKEWDPESRQRRFLESGLPRDEWVAQVITQVFGEILPREMAKDLLQVFDTFKPDIVVRDEREFGAWIASELANIPCAVSCYLHEPPSPGIKDLVGESLNRVRLEFGMQPDPDLKSLNHWLNLVPTPMSWGAFQREALPSSHRIRPSLFDPSGEDDLPSWLKQPSDRPRVYVGMGTEVNRVPGLFETVIEGLQKESLEVICSLGKGHDSEDLLSKFKIRSNVQVASQLPFPSTIARCDVVVCHGGAMTLLASLLHGVPVVCIPIGGDGYLNAELIKEAGVGESIDFDPSDRSSIRDAVINVLDEPSFNERANRFSEEMADLPDVYSGVPVLQRIVETRSPLVAVS